MKHCQLLVVDAAEVVSPEYDPVTGTASPDRLCRIPDGAVAVADGVILDVGHGRELREGWRADEVISAAGGAVTPGFCDPHTHLLFAGWRGAEFAQRVTGRPRRDSGLSGGIGDTVAATTACADDQLDELLRRRLDHWLLCGFTLVEIKSGYGLTQQSELRMLETIRRVASAHPVEVVSTVLAAHALPAAYQGNARGYLADVAWPVSRIASERKLAEYVDAFVETGAFRPEEVESYLERCRDLGLGLRVHAEQLSRGGASRLAVRLGAASVDHLENAGREEVAALAGSDTVAILLPGAVLTLEGRGSIRPPARALIEAGVAVALASDFNPGTSTQTSPTLTLPLACRLLAMSPDEVMTAVTINAARSLGRERGHGALAVGYRADICIWSLPLATDLSYRLEAHRPRHVVVAGQVVVRDGRLCGASGRATASGEDPQGMAFQAP